MIYFIPARSGSERVKGKHHKNLGGKPLINWTFDILDAGKDNVLVSSDDEEILKQARKRKFKAVKRPPHLCGSASKMSDVLFYHANDFREGPVCVLYPTSPLRTRKHVDEATSLWGKIVDQRVGQDFVLMSVAGVGHRPYGLMDIGKHGELELHDKTGMDYYRGQDTPTLYRANGAIYVIPSGLIREKKINSQLFGERTFPFTMDKLSSLEVDDEADFQIMDSLLAAHK